MNSEIFKVLDYTKGIMYQDLNQFEVRFICFTLMMQPSPSFDMIASGKFVTSCFTEDSETKEWKYLPVEQWNEMKGKGD